MARTGDDAIFLSAYYRHRDTLAVRAVSAEARKMLAGRLTALGFGQAAVVELSIAQDIGQAMEKDVLTAQAHLVAGNPQFARTMLAGINSDEARRLMAQVEEQLGAHGVAAALYANPDRGCPGPQLHYRLSIAYRPDGGADGQPQGQTRIALAAVGERQVRCSQATGVASGCDFRTRRCQQRKARQAAS